MKLKQAILNYIETGTGDFNQLALAVFDYQFHHCQAYQHYCNQLDSTPDNITHWQQIPAVSTDVFREFDLCTFDPKQAKYIFETSGTTQEIKGKHYYQDMSLYDAVIRNSFMKGLGLSNQSSPIFRILTPSFAQVSTSSLFYMLQCAKEWYGAKESKFYFQNDDIDYDALTKDLAEDIELNRPLVLIGTAFSFVNLFDQFQENWPLPKGSSLMETGGLKGRTRAVSRVELYDLFEVRLGMDRQHCFSEYGMTELSSQCYSEPNSHIFKAPDTMPVRLINPETNQEVEYGESGLVQFFDLANLEAVSAIITADLAIKRVNGFELIGRSPLSILRGCSTRFDTIGAT